MSNKLSFNELRRKGVVDLEAIIREVVQRIGGTENLFPRRSSAPDPISGSAQGWWSTVAGAPRMTLASEDGGTTLQFAMTEPEDSPPPEGEGLSEPPFIEFI